MVAQRSVSDQRCVVTAKMDHGGAAGGETAEGVPTVHPDATPHKRQNSRAGPPVPDLEALANAMSPEPVTPPAAKSTPMVVSVATPPQTGRTRAGARGRSGPAPTRTVGSLPEEPLSPGPNCHPDEIKDWAARVFDNIDRQISDVVA